MNRCSLIPAAWLLDQLAGDPEWLPHPVRLIGFATARGEAALRRPNQSELSEFISGGTLSLAVVATSYYATRQLIRLANRLSPALGNTVEVLLAWTCLAARNLEQEAISVVNALDSGDLPLARHRLARIVGRDTLHLDTHEICRALIETLAESASDGILAPLFYMALGGVPLAMAYKTINTLDSMIGHADERYFYFGKAAARLDDAANYLPARLTAAAIVAVSNFHERSDPLAAWQTWRRDGDEHKSPNAGQPESAMAGALHVRLGGDNTYGGELIRAAHIGHEFSRPSLPKAKGAIRLVSVVTLLGVACGVLLSACVQSREASGTSR
ncbi:adenosylcobinamide-phosphate synthase CbiB [Edaphobacter modestus]|uniref:Cobalamin biosynthesis protein CobD n=1 Tax=Edaphobacter modestus TaxID=388466 RepID=A0A4Q7YQX2_9BACT|nr:adenosylcobinamide-phosphate synthase CbiB [Edaphobacter modestus]RZU40162.1 adenosylcobinamide-phosphate synthase [Edaphobacter modestus]